MTFSSYSLIGLGIGLLQSAGNDVHLDLGLRDASLLALGAPLASIQWSERFAYFALSGLTGFQTSVVFPVLEYHCANP